MPPAPAGPVGQRCSATNTRPWPGGSAPPTGSSVGVARESGREPFLLLAARAPVSGGRWPPTLMVPGPLNGAGCTKVSLPSLPIRENVGDPGHPSMPRLYPHPEAPPAKGCPVWWHWSYPGWVHQPAIHLHRVPVMGGVKLGVELRGWEWGTGDAEPLVATSQATVSPGALPMQLMAAAVNVFDGQASLPTLLLGRSAALSTFHQSGTTAASEPSWELYKNRGWESSQGVTKLLLEQQRLVAVDPVEW